MYCVFLADVVVHHCWVVNDPVTVAASVADLAASIQLGATRLFVHDTLATFLLLDFLNVITSIDGIRENLPMPRETLEVLNYRKINKYLYL